MYLADFENKIIEKPCTHILVLMFATALEQRNGQLKRFDERIYSIVKFNLALLTEFSLFCLPNSNVSSTFPTLSKRLCL